MANKTNSLAHTKWMCKYHIVFSPKYRRKVIYNQYRESLQDIIRTLCRYKGVEILEGHMMSDHVHLALSIPPAQVSHKAISVNWSAESSFCVRPESLRASMIACRIACSGCNASYSFWNSGSWSCSFKKSLNFCSLFFPPDDCWLQYWEVSIWLCSITSRLCHNLQGVVLSQTASSLK